MSSESAPHRPTRGCELNPIVPVSTGAEKSDDVYIACTHACDDACDVWTLPLHYSRRALHAHVLVCVFYFFRSHRIIPLLLKRRRML